MSEPQDLVEEMWHPGKYPSPVDIWFSLCFKTCSCLVKEAERKIQKTWSVVYQWDEAKAFPSPLIQGFSFPYIRRQVDSTGKRELVAQKKTEYKLWGKGWGRGREWQQLLGECGRITQERMWSGGIKTVGTVYNGHLWSRKRVVIFFCNRWEKD